MPKRRSRYSTSLATDWTYPVPSAAEEPSPKESLSKEDEVQRLDHASNTRLASPDAPMHSTKKAKRYKKVLPSNWIDSDSSLRTVDESARTQIIDSQVQPNMHSSYYGYFGTGNIDRRMDRPKGPGIVPLIPTAGDSQYAPPPAPTRALFPFQEADRRYGAPMNVSFNTTGRRLTGSTFRESPETRLRDRSLERSFQFRDQQAAHVPVYSHDTPVHYSAISPPVSVGQQSSEATTSPFHGRDLPARGPTVSPTYSFL